MADDLNRKVQKLLTNRPWYKLPRLLAKPRLVEIRNELRKKNLHDTEEPPLQKQAIPKIWIPSSSGADHRWDLQRPPLSGDGSCGRRFGRNVPLKHVFSGHGAAVDTQPPGRQPRVDDARRVQGRADILNLLAAAWIQFMVHDWFVHKRHRSMTASRYRWRRATIGRIRECECRARCPSLRPAGSTRPPVYANPNSHWWDASQVYGSDPTVAAKVRTHEGGKLKVESTGLLPVDPATGVHFSGFTDNWWIGLAMLHTLFTLEHNHICDLLAKEHPDWNDNQLYGKAKLINAAIMAKIHTVEWTPAIVPHPIIKTGMHANWYGLADPELIEVFKFLNESEILGGIIGSKADHHTAPYSLTEEFVAVYRMHPLIPDTFDFRSLSSGA